MISKAVLRVAPLNHCYWTRRQVRSVGRICYSIALVLCIMPTKQIQNAREPKTSATRLFPQAHYNTTVKFSRQNCGPSTTKEPALQLCFAPVVRNMELCDTLSPRSLEGSTTFCALAFKQRNRASTLVHNAIRRRPENKPASDKPGEAGCGSYIFRRTVCMEHDFFRTLHAAAKKTRPSRVEN